MAKKKLTPNQQAYKKQIKRIKAALRREEKKGFITNQIRAKLLDRPSRITQKFLETLRSITPKFIRKHSPFQSQSPMTVDPSPVKFEMPTPTDEYTYTPAPHEDTSEYQWDDYDYDHYSSADAFEELATGLDKLPKHYEEPLPSPQQDAEPEFPDYAYYREESLGWAGKEYYLYDADGNIVSKIEPIIEDREVVGYVDQVTGEMFETRADVERYLRQGDVVSQPIVPIPDLTDYAIGAIYDQTADLDNAVNNVMHNIFDAVRDRIGDQGFYEGMTEGNGFRSAFETLTQTLHSGGGYPEAFTKFGAKVIEDLPVTDAEAQELETAFNEIIFAAFGADVE